MSIFASKNDNSVFLFMQKFSVVLHAADKSRMVYIIQDINHCWNVKNRRHFSADLFTVFRNVFWDLLYIMK